MQDEGGKELSVMSNERLIGLSASFQGKIYEIGELLTIGRNPDNRLQLDDLQVSRKHALIQATPNGFMLKDLGSGNGTYIGNRRIIEYRLSPNDVIRIGNQEFRFETGAEIDALNPPEPAVQANVCPSGVRFHHGAEGRFEATDAANMYQTLFQHAAPKVTEEELRETQQRLKAIYTANQIITSERNLTTLFERVMDQLFALVPAHNGVILLKDSQSGELVTEYVKSGQENTEVVISSTIVNRAFAKGEAVITYDAADDSRFDAGASIITQNIASAMCAPLIHQNERLGVLYVDTRGATNAFVAGDLELLVALAGPAAIAIRNAQYLRMVEQGYQDTLITLANAIEMRDHYTVGHTWRVTHFSMAIARELGWSDEKLKEVQMGGVLHDVGKIAVDDAILRKPTRLTDEEFAKMKIHPERGAQLLRDVGFMHPLIPYCLYHHERYDGNGYPFALAGDDIPIEGRVVAVADTFDAMTSNRPYRKGLDPEFAIQEIEKASGTQFDPQCVDALIRAYRSQKIAQILQDYYKTGFKSIACPFCSTFIRLPDDIQDGAIIECNVCHRNIRVRIENDTYFGELLPQRSPSATPPLNNHDT